MCRVGEVCLLLLLSDLEAILPPSFFLAWAMLLFPHHDALFSSIFFNYFVYFVN